MEVSSATNMMEKIVDLLMETNQLGKRNREYLKNALLLRHRWANNVIVVVMLL